MPASHPGPSPSGTAAPGTAAPGTAAPGTAAPGTAAAATATGPATRAGSIRFGGDPVPRFGFGLMQLPGPGALGPPRDRQGAIDVLRRAYELGVRFFDTSGYYGPDVANELLAAALRPYPADVLIASKVGARREGRGFAPASTPDEVRAAVERDVQVLGVEAIDVVHVRRMPGDPTPFTEPVAAVQALRERGLVRHLGASNVTVEELREAQEIAEVVSVENEYNLRLRASEPLLEIAGHEGLAFLPFHPLDLGRLAQGPGPVTEVADELGASPAQVALAWLLRQSAAMLPIPGTSTVAHLDENVAAVELELTPDQADRLDAVAE